MDLPAGGIEVLEGHCQFVVSAEHRISNLQSYKVVSSGVLKLKFEQPNFSRLDFCLHFQTAAFKRNLLKDCVHVAS